MCSITELEAIPASLVTREEPAMQRVDIACRASCDAHLRLTVVRDRQTVCADLPIAVRAGRNAVPVLLPAADRETGARCTLRDGGGHSVAEYSFRWAPPRHWTLYAIRSSHTDIGLHNSPYIQRHNCSRFLEKAVRLCDRTSTWGDAERYRYVVEGTWIWGNYCADQGTAAGRRVVDEYVHAGLISVGGTTAGNHTQVFGLEELCRSAYTRSRLESDWGIDSRTMTMVDNNGMTWALVAPYADAGFQNILFAPNQWNPLPSTIWPRDNSIAGAQWNPDASGGGARVDVRYDSALPMVFYWQGADDQSKLLVWCSTQYHWGGCAFGLTPGMSSSPQSLAAMEASTASQLVRLESRYPYDIWVFACYCDDEEPNLSVNQAMRDWNRKWRSPEYRAVGDLDAPFDRLRQKFGAQIPTLRGDITGGWFQHPLSTPELLAQKLAADRLLPTAEKLATVAGVCAPGYHYPATDFRRAWDALICNDEHSYGTSGYQGRRVYETWLQHRDWIDKAEAVARQESDRALRALAAQIAAAAPALVLFNPTLQSRRELLELEQEAGPPLKFLSPQVPSFGYTTIPLDALPAAAAATVEHPAEPPVVENRFYRLTFGPDGSVSSMFDKELNRELLDAGAPFRGCQFVYTADNHRSFSTPRQARFRIERDPCTVTVVAVTDEPVSGAAIEQRITLPGHEKRIDIDNRLSHVRDLINQRRYYRYGYYAFPFAVEDATPRVQLNGCIAVPGRDQTGHGTETYMAAREWCCVENGRFGVALLQLDSQLVEFGEIHRDKTDSCLPPPGSGVYSYLFNDWLQMHTPGGSHVNPRFRYSVVSYAGDFRKVGVAHLGERLAQPLLCCRIPAQDGALPEGEHSFWESDPGNLRLLALKRAEDGNGVVARFQEALGQPVAGACLRQSLVPGGALSLCTVDERPKGMPLDATCFSVVKHGCLTLRLTGFDLRALPETVAERVAGQPAAIGSVYTGLVTEPRAVCGENQGHLYLEWGQNAEPDLSHYELYRGEKSGFLPDQASSIGEVAPGPYRVALYEDRNLRTHTTYYYRVRAVNRKGQCGEFSREFSGVTRE